MFLASETGVSDFSGTGDTAYYCSVLYYLNPICVAS